MTAGPESLQLETVSTFERGLAMTPLFSISPRRVTKILILAVLCLTIASVMSIFVEYIVGHEYIKGTETFVELFDVDTEGNIPTWYASSTLLLCSFLLATIARS